MLNLELDIHMWWSPTSYELKIKSLQKNFKKTSNIRVLYLTRKGKFGSYKVSLLSETVTS